MRRHFSRVKDCVLVAVQRRDAGRAEHETLIKKMGEKQTALKSGSSPLALSSFPKLSDRLCDFSQRLTGSQEGSGGKDVSCHDKPSAGRSAFRYLPRWNRRSGCSG